jgi:putative GTP pyrophosphokinase
MPHMATTPSLNALSEFERIRPEYARFTAKLENLLRDLLRAKSIDIHLIESRTKELSSLKDKITRSSKTHTDPLTEFTDLSGLRIITYYNDDADAVAKLIEAEFTIDRENSIIHSFSGAEFGYKSTHYIVSLSQGRSALLEWAGTQNLKAEVQVRTVLQHAWAAISHKLQYKREEDVPAVLRRKLSRLSALFELADDEFVSLRDASGEVTREITKLIATGTRRLPLDYVSLGQFLETSEVVSKLCTAAEEVGFDFEEDAPQSEEARDGISDLIQFCFLAGVTNTEDLEDCLRSSLRWAKGYLDAQLKENQDEPEEKDGPADVSVWYVTPSFVCELMMICLASNRIGFDDLIRLGFHKTIATRVYEVAKRFSAEA